MPYRMAFAALLKARTRRRAFAGSQRNQGCFWQPSREGTEYLQSGEDWVRFGVGASSADSTRRRFPFRRETSPLPQSQSGALAVPRAQTRAGGLALLVRVRSAVGSP